MAVVLVLWAAIAVFLAIIFGFVLYFLGVPDTLAVYSGIGLWSLLVGWILAACVIVGRERSRDRTSARDITALQVVLLIGIGSVAFRAPETDVSWRSVELGSEWMIMVIHVVYFLLAWATRARVPLKTYLIFLCLLALVLIRS